MVGIQRLSLPEVSITDCYLPACRAGPDSPVLGGQELPHNLRSRDGEAKNERTTPGSRQGRGLAATSRLPAYSAQQPGLTLPQPSLERLFFVEAAGSKFRRYAPRTSAS
jgi:hypothetical protein